MDKALLPHFGWRDDFQTLQYERCVLHPYATRLGLTNTQIGFGFTVYAIIQTVGLFSSLYIADRFRKDLTARRVDRCGPLWRILSHASTVYRLSHRLWCYGILGKWFTGLYC